MDAGSILFDRYRLEEYLGAGGMGIVWRATDLLLEQSVALKRVSLGHASAQEAELVQARTLREARTAAVLRHHPHVVATYDVLVEDGDAWLVLEYVPSLSLAALLRERGTLGIVEVAGIGARVADALAASHGHGIVHRDVTPGNVLVGADATVKLTDFGLSRPIATHDQLTQSGVITGTIAYLAPEVASGGDSTPASDVFSLGSTLYAAIEGQPPFGTDSNSLRLLNVVRTGIVRPPTSAGALTPVLMRLLELDPATRPDAATVRDLLDEFAHRASAATEYLPPEEQTHHTTASTQTRQPKAAGHDSRRRRSRTWLRTWLRGPRNRPRRRGLIAALAAIVTAGIVAVLAPTFFGERSPALTGTPPLPTHVGPVALTGDPKAADPCPLIDLDWLRQFGYPQIIVPSVPHECRVEITTSVGAPAWVSMGYYTPILPRTRINKPVEQLGGLSVIRNLPVSDARRPSCENMILLSDQTRVLAIAEADGQGSDLCQLADVATATAATALADHGVTYRPGRTSGWAIARADACALLTANDFAAAGITPTVRDPGYGNWWCHWAAAPTSVELTLRLDTARVANYGTPTTIAGHQAWLDNATAGPPRCAAFVVSHPASSLTDATELIEVSYQAPQHGQELCTHAAQLATAALARLHTP